jgi:radical SAM protein with 4Fe4S-binding SPASM domain
LTTSPLSLELPAPTTTRRGAGELLAKAGLKSGAPVTVTFQVTDRCHLDCVHCYQTHGTKGELTLEEIDRVFGEIAAEGTLFLTLTGGEFFMRRDADDILRLSRKHKFAVKLLTTGWHIDDRRAELIRDLGAMQVDLSFYSAEACEHDRVTQVTGSWQRTVDAARRLRARGVLVILKAPVMSMNVAGMTEIARAAAELDCGFTFDPKVTGREDGDMEPAHLRATDDDLRAFYGDERMGIWQVLENAYKGVPRASLNALDQTPCRAGQDVCGITPEGLVTACHSIPASAGAGDLRQHSFREIWRTSHAIKRIREMTWGSISECATCDVRPYCTRCHAMAFLEDGDITGPSTEACRHAVLIRDMLRDREVISAGDTGQPPPRRVRPPSLRVIG